MENKAPGKNIVYLLITAVIWGAAFVAQREGGDVLGPYLFSFLRFIIGGIVLIPVILILDKLKLTQNKPVNEEDWKKLLICGGSCGTILAIFTILQQLGLYYGTTAGKAGFLTSCYIVLVPVLGIFVKRKCRLNVWIAVGITVVGLYLLCINESFGFNKSDLFILGCSLLCATHILVVDRYTAELDGVRMSCIQFFAAGIISLIPTLIVDVGRGGLDAAQLGNLLSGRAVWIALLYTGVLSSGVAYTFQIIGQKNMNPTIASLLMSLESVFSVIAGALILGERMGTREMTGCVLIFTAVVLAQVEFKAGRKSSG